MDLDLDRKSFEDPKLLVIYDYIIGVLYCLISGKFRVHYAGKQTSIVNSKLPSTS